MLYGATTRCLIIDRSLHRPLVYRTTSFLRDPLGVFRLVPSLRGLAYRHARPRCQGPRLGTRCRLGVARLCLNPQAFRIRQATLSYVHFSHAVVSGRTSRSSSSTSAMAASPQFPGSRVPAGNGRVGEGVTAPLPPQNRACASNALGSSHGSFALSRRSRLSMAVPCTGCRNSSFRPVSQPWPCTCDAGLSSDGSRRPRFPAVYGTMPALRPPARRPLDLFLRQPVPRFAC